MRNPRPVSAAASREAMEEKHCRPIHLTDKPICAAAAALFSPRSMKRQGKVPAPRIDDVERMDTAGSMTWSKLTILPRLIFRGGLEDHPSLKIDL